MKKTKLFLAILGFFTMGQFAFAQPGSTFSNSDTVTSLPFLRTGETTCGFGDNYTTADIACIGNFMTGEEKIYSFTPATTMNNIQVSMTNIVDNFSGLFITDDSTNTGNCMASITGTGNADRVVTNLTLIGGTTYYFIVSSWANPQCLSSYDFQVLDQTCPAPSMFVVNPLTDQDAMASWMETGSATQWEIEYDTIGFVLGTGTSVLTAINPYTITGLSATTTYDAYIRAVCGPGDSSYWVGPYTFTTPCTPITAPMMEAFDNAGTPLCWDQTAITGGPWRTTGTPGYGASGAQDHTGNGGDFIWMDYSGTDISVSLVSTIVDVSALTIPYFSFWHFVNNTNDTSTNILYVETWSGSNWVQLDSIRVNTGGWTEFSYNLTGFTYGTSLFKVRFRAESGGSGNDYFQDVLLDDISVMEMPTCFAPLAVTLDTALATTAIISWTEPGAATQWEVEYDVAGFTPGTGANMMIASSNPFSLSGLIPATSYDFYVRSICGAGDSSLFSGVLTFSTTCISLIAPVTESFDNPVLPLCWSQTAVTGGPWRFTGTPGYGASGATDHTGNGGEFIWMDFSGTDVAVSLITPDVDVSALTVPYLEFYFYTNNTNDGAINDLIVEAWSGTTWVTVDSISQNLGGWTSFGYDVSSFTFSTNTVKFRFRAESGTGGADFYQDFLLDDISVVEAPSCIAPSSLSAYPIGTSADLSWVSAATASSWEVEYDVAGFTLGTGINAITSNNPYTVSGLTVLTDYDYYVRSICGPGDTSLWSGPFTFTTTASCPEPVQLTATIHSDSADLAWTEYGSATLWEYEYGVFGYTQGAGISDTTSSNPQLITGLSYATSYQYYVRSICGVGDTSLWAGPFTFTLPCVTYTPFYSETFNTFVPNCWDEANSGTLATGPTAIGAGSWNGGSAIGSTVKINMYSNFLSDWVLSPNFDLSSGGYEVSIDAAVTNWLGSTPDAMGSDDSVFVVYSDDGVTWNTLITWTAADALPNSLTNFTASIPSTGSNVQFGILGSDGTVNDPEDYDFHFDNFEVRNPPTCSAPNSLFANSTTNTSLEFGWTETGSATLWEVEYDTTGFVQGTGTSDTTSSNPYSILGLAINTTYDMYVRSICGAGDTSVWVGPISFVNGYCVPNPATVDGQGITNVTMDTLNNTTGIEPGNYGDFSSMIAVAYQGASLPISITLQTGYTYNLWAWVDWNNDFDFDDPGEANYLGESSFANPTTFLGQLQIPFTASVGNHRIRIGGADGGLGTTAPSFPCYTGFWGCMEDYTLLVNVPSCLAPGPIVENSISSTTVELSWTENGSATLWEYEYGTTGFVQGAGLVLDTTSVNPLSITGLTPSTNYQFYVRSVCAVGDSSSWTGPFDFGTPCNVIDTYPFNETFDIASGTTPSPTMACWSMVDSTGIGALFYVTAGNFGGALSTTVASQYNLAYLNINTFVSGPEVADFVSPTFDLTSLSRPTVSFWYSNEVDNGNQNKIQLLQRASSSDPWSEIWMDTNSVSVWTEVVLPIPNASASYEFAIRMTLNTGWRGTGATVDEFRVYEGPELGADTVLCTNESMTLDPGSFTGYLWNDTTITTTHFVDATVLSEGTETVSVILTDSTGFKMYDTITVIIEKPVIDLGADSILCYGEVLTLDADTGFVSYVWQDGSTMQTIVTDGTTVGTTKYEVLGTTALGCPAIDSVNISVNTQVLVDLGVDTAFYDSILQNATTYTLDAGPGFASYLWSDAAATTTQTIVIDGANDGDISVIVTNSSGCTGTDTVKVDFKLGINSFEVSTLTMYPNPATDNITISVTNFNSLDVINVTILDITGKVIMIQKLEGNGNKFQGTYDVSKFATGTYFVQFEADGDVVTRQFVIK